MEGGHVYSASTRDPAGLAASLDCTGQDRSPGRSGHGDEKAGPPTAPSSGEQAAGPWRSLHPPPPARPAGLSGSMRITSCYKYAGQPENQSGRWAAG